VNWAYSDRTFALIAGSVITGTATILSEYLRPEDESEALTRLQAFRRRDARANKIRKARVERMCAGGELSSAQQSLLNEAREALQDARKLLGSANRRPGPAGFLERLLNQ
jgi:hypothetical protein